MAEKTENKATEEKKYEVMNDMVFRGTIVGIRGRSDFGIMTLACPSIVYPKIDGKISPAVRTNYPILFFNANQTKAANIVERFKRGDRVVAACSVRSNITLNEYGGIMENIRVILKDIQPDRSIIERAFHMKGGRGYRPALNEGHFIAPVADVQEQKNGNYIIRLNLSENQQPNVVTFRYFHAPKNVMKSLNRGDWICAAAMVQTADFNDQPAEPQRGSRAPSRHELVITDMVPLTTGSEREEEIEI